MYSSFGKINEPILQPADLQLSNIWRDKLHCSLVRAQNQQPTCVIRLKSWSRVVNRSV